MVVKHGILFMTLSMFICNILCILKGMSMTGTLIGMEKNTVDIPKSRPYI